ncbi:hypothetical protein ES708_30584 [subsurface metagenome]
MNDQVDDVVDAEPSLATAYQLYMVPSDNPSHETDAVPPLKTPVSVPIKLSSNAL